MPAILLSLLASLCWGSGDLLAGLCSRRASTWSVTLVSQIVGLSVGLLVLLAVGRPWVGWDALWPSLGAGVLLSLGMVSYFQGLAIGTMSVVAPIAGVGVVVPVVLGLMRGDDPSSLQLLGVAASVAGVVLASIERGRDEAVTGTIEVGVDAIALQGDETGDTVPRRASARHDDRLAALLAALSAVCFGFVMVGFSLTAQHDPLWPAVGGRATSVLVLSAIAIVHGARMSRRTPAGGEAMASVGPTRARPPHSTAQGLTRFIDLPLSVLPVTVAAGVLHLGAATLYSFATTQGLLSLVSVLSSLTAVVIVALAHLFLHERLDRLQWVGVALAVCGVLAIAAG